MNFEQNYKNLKIYIKKTIFLHCITALDSHLQHGGVDGEFVEE
jgi:hypothetical protein